MDDQQSEKNALSLSGKVTAVTYHNDISGWTVLTIDHQGESLQVVGIMTKPNPGEWLELTGEYVEHPTYGTQFSADSCERHLPDRSEDILDYLMSGAVKGIGRVIATEMIRHFGDEALSVLEREPLRLAEIKSVSPAKARMLGEEFRKQFGMREAVLACTEFGMQPAEAMRCWQRWGQSVVDRLKKNPYDFCHPDLQIGFDRIDDICLSRGIEPEDENRLAAGIAHVLLHNMGNGHTCLPKDRLVPTAAALLGVELDSIERRLTQMAEARQLIIQPLKEQLFVFLPEMYTAEKNIAQDISFRADLAVMAEDREIDKRILEIEKQNGIQYESEQKKAIQAALSRGLLILTGGPGTGKTTTLKAVLMLLEADGEEVALAAPTGRAAQRLSEMTGREAKTIHRLLKAQWGPHGEQEFVQNERNPLEASTVIVDELSMVDVRLFDKLLRALKPSCRLIMVGDTDQLPAVGAGNVLGDLIDSGRLPVVKLTQIFRQAMTSEIVTNAHRIVAGEPLRWSDRNGDCFLLSKGNYTAVTETVMDLCCRRLPETYGTTVYNNIQILCPGRKGELGTIELNRRLQEKLNPPRPDVRCVNLRGTMLRVGDKVMQIRNNYDLTWTHEDGTVGSGVFNGDIGLLCKVDPPEKTLTVNYDGRMVSYTYQEAEDLELAYAITIHKSQGSEFDMVVLPLYRTQPKLAYRNLLYTAVTRAKSLLIVVGTEEAVNKMIENNRRTKRYTALCAFLEDASGDPNA